MTLHTPEFFTLISESPLKEEEPSPRQQTPQGPRTGVGAGSKGRGSL